MPKVFPVGYLRIALLCAFLCTKLAYSQSNLVNNTTTFNGTKTIGASGADYTSITNALTAANASGIDGPVILSLQANYSSASETFPVTLSNVNGLSAVNTITIVPATTGLTITSNSVVATININGGKYFTIDGRVNGTGSTKDLTIVNTSNSSGGTAIQLLNDASNNTIKYCKLKSSYNGTSFGVVTFSTTTGTTGNDNNLIDNCDIDGNSGSCLNGVYSVGTITTSTLNNSNNTISNCNIFDFYNAGATTSSGISLISGNTDWTINGNSFYQTTSRTATNTDFIYVINISSTSGNNFIITNNYIGGSQANAGGSAWTASSSFASKFRGISLSVGSSTPSSIQGNTITNINFSTTTNTSTIPGIFAGIYLTAGYANIGTSSGNVIGGATGNGAITVITSSNGAGTYGIAIDASSIVASVSNNTIGSITTQGSSTSISSSFTGIASSSASSTITLSGNLIGSTSTAKSINAITNATSATAQVVTGINNSGNSTISITNNTVANLYNDYLPATTSASLVRGIINTSGTPTITGNTIYNLSTAAFAVGTNASSSVIGLSISNTTTPLTLSQNTIHSLSNTNVSAAVFLTGIYISGPTSGTNTIDKNLIHSLKLTTAGAGVIYGINISAGSVTYKNNMISLGVDETGSSITSAYDYRGINEGAGSNNFYSNSIYVGGTGVASGTTNSYAFITSATTSIRAIQNNIFVNNRSNATGTGVNHACYFVGELPITTRLTCDNNIYYANGVGGAIIKNNSTTYTLNGWKIASNLDFNSHQADPNFILPNGTSSTTNLHIQGTTTAEGNGVNIASVTDDYDGSTRSSLTPTDIGADAGNFTSVDACSSAIIYIPIGNGTTANKTLTNFASISDNAGVSASSKPRIYFKKSIENDAFVGNTNADNGWKYVVASNASSPYSFTIDYSLLNSTINNSDVIQYFVVAQDLTNNLTSNPDGATASTSPVVENINAKPSTVNSYTIVNSTISGTVNVGSGETYTSLTGSGGLFADLNSKVLTTNLTVNITSDLIEDGSNSLNALSEEPNGSNFTITIQPNSNTMRTISGTVVSTGNPMINISGADNLIIDGRSGGAGKYLTFRNTNATPSFTGAAIQFINGCINTTLRNCIIETNESTSSRGNIILGSTGTNNVTITTNDIGNATAGTTGQESNAIYSNSTLNFGSITSNNIYNFSNIGVALSNVADGFTINSNSFYSSIASTTSITGISILSGNNLTISDNYIGGSASNAGGSAWSINASGVTFKGIVNSGSTVIANSIQNNAIQNINLSHASSSIFNGIEVSGGYCNIGSSTGNIVGHASIANSIINAGSSSTNGILISTGLQCTISNNTIANISATGTGAGVSLRGITHIGGGLISVSSNLIHDLTSNSTSPTSNSTISVCGIQTSGITNPSIFTKNQIYNLNAVTASAEVYSIGIAFNSSASDFTATKNKIYGLTNTSTNTAASIYGILIYTGGSTLTNNMIHLSNGLNSNGPNIAGIECKNLSTKSNIIYYNTIRIAGTASSSLKTFCIGRETNESVMDVKNNIFINERTGGSGKHYSIYNYSGSSGWSSSASNYNILYSSNSSTTGFWTTDQSFSGFQTASGGEANSKNVDVNFADENNGDLHIAGVSIGSANLNGILASSITQDFDDNVRPSISGTPYIGADEVTASPLPITLFSFEGNANSNYNLLTWITTTEINSCCFELERLNEEQEFISIGSISANGNSKEINQYKFQDLSYNKSSNVDYYRLKIIDVNNGYTYSDIIAVKRNSKNPSTVKLFPNPVQDKIQLLIIDELDQVISIKIIDMYGKVIWEEKDYPRNFINSINTSNLPNGIYTLQVIGIDENKSLKFIKE